MRLGEICDIQLGLTPRGKLEPSDFGGLRVIQLRDVGVDGEVDFDQLQKLDIERPSDRYAVRPGDIIFRSRGAFNTATAITSPVAEPVFAALPIFILRPTEQKADPGYVAWAINQEPAQSYLDREAQGQTVRMISKASLENLPLDLPPLSVQRLIVEIDGLIAREKQLSDQLTKNRSTLWRRILTDKAKSASRKGNPS